MVDLDTLARWYNDKIKGASIFSSPPCNSASFGNMIFWNVVMTIVVELIQDPILFLKKHNIFLLMNLVRINKKKDTAKLWKGSLNCDGHQFLQSQQNKLPLLTFTNWTDKQPRHIQFLAWNRHKNGERFNRLMRSQTPFLWIWLLLSTLS